MDNILGKIIELDDFAKNKIKTIKEKEENIETYIGEQIEKEKEIIDNRFLYKRKKLQEKYDEMFEKEKERLNNEKQQIIEMIIQEIV